MSAAWLERVRSSMPLRGLVHHACVSGEPGRGGDSALVSLGMWQKCSLGFQPKTKFKKGTLEKTHSLLGWYSRAKVHATSPPPPPPRIWSPFRNRSNPGQIPVKFPPLALIAVDTGQPPSRSRETGQLPIQTSQILSCYRSNSGVGGRQRVSRSKPLPAAPESAGSGANSL